MATTIPKTKNEKKERKNKTKNGFNQYLNVGEYKNLHMNKTENLLPTKN